MKILAAVILTLAFLAAGNADYSDEMDQQDIYCAMVSEGSWPAYDKSIDCGE